MVHVYGQRYEVKFFYNMFVLDLIFGLLKIKLLQINACYFIYLSFCLILDIIYNSCSMAVLFFKYCLFVLYNIFGIFTCFCFSFYIIFFILDFFDSKKKKTGFLFFIFIFIFKIPKILLDFFTYDVFSSQNEQKESIGKKQTAYQSDFFVEDQVLENGFRSEISPRIKSVRIIKEPLVRYYEKDSFEDSENDWEDNFYISTPSDYSNNSNLINNDTKKRIYSPIENFDNKQEALNRMGREIEGNFYYQK